MSWESAEPERDMTRRRWVRLAMAAGAVGTLGALGGTVAGQLLPPPVRFSGTIRETIIYTKIDTPQWWDTHAGSPIRVTDLKEWQGAAGVWRGLYDDNEWIPGTGLPILAIRVARDDSAFRAPADVSLPKGFSLFFDDAETDTRIVVTSQRCVHLCCPPGWHFVTDLLPEHVYENYAPTWERFGVDPIFCKCHGSQYDPMNLVWDVHPRTLARYVGAEFVHGPAARALPIVPVRSESGVLLGGIADPRWYDYCG